MPSSAPDDLPLTELAPGYTTRFADWGGMTVVFERIAAGQDVSSMLEELPDGRCQANHWGYLLKGRVVADYGSHEETIEAGQAYYVAPGHRLTVLEDSEALEFTPADDLEVTLAALRANEDAAAGSDRS
jgi:hypothetical protein